MTIQDMIIRIAMAIVIGGFVGYEREMRNRPAGFVTHTLVCVGACVVSLMQIHMVADTVAQIEANPMLAGALKADIGRVVAQVVTGVGFLGAGTIIFDKGSVKGLTTATTIWVVACIGLAIGMGYYQLSIIAGVGVSFIMIGLKSLESKALNRKYSITIDIGYNIKSGNFIKDMIKFLKRNKIQVRDIELLERNENENIETCRFKLYTGFGKAPDRLIQKITQNEDVISVTKKK